MRRGGQNLGMGFNNSPGRPLLTNHLKDIDLELELLKRKREMLEQQTNLYDSPMYDSPAFNQSRKYGSVPPPFEPNKFGSSRDYSSMYDDAPHHSRKRHSEPVWEHDTPKKYPSRPKKKNIPSLFANRMGPKPSPQFAPKNTGPPEKFPNPFATSQNRPSIGQKINSRKPRQRPPANFAPKKVSKPKPAQPNAIAARPVQERAVLVNEAIKSSAQADELILREDRVPTQQMTGRLELALGSILKEIKEVYGESAPYDSIFRSPTLQRVMKQAIRERVKCVMLGKVVGPFAEILQIYRNEYPRETDIDIVTIAMDAAGITKDETPTPAVTKTVETAKPEDSYKMGMYNLLNGRVKAMFDKIHELYKQDFEGQVNENSKKEINFAEDNLDEQGNLEGDTKPVEQPVEQIVPQTTPDTKNYMVKRMLPGLLRKYMPVVLDILNYDQEYQTTREQLWLNAKAKQSQPNESQKGENAQEMKENGDKSNEPRSQLPYFVKVLARPSLPKRKVMRDFLDQFNCKTIKKHRNVHNMLFIGFSEKSDYDNIMAATGTVIGRATIQIFPSEKAASSNKDEPAADIDGQISDLLTSVRNAEEQEGKQENQTEGQETEKETATDQGNEDSQGQVEDSQVTEQSFDLNDSDVQLIENNEVHEIIDDDDDAVENKDDGNNQNNGDVNAELDDNPTGFEDNLTDGSDYVERQTQVEETTENLVENETTENVVENETTGNVVETETTDNVVENETTGNVEESEKAEEQKKDAVAQLKSEEVKQAGRATPTRMTRSANVTPSTIRTRRASRLANQN